MGQDYKLINLDKKEYVDPYDIGVGGKLWEWMADIKGCGVITLLLSERWAGDKVGLVGDYDSEFYYKILDTYKDISGYAKIIYGDYRPDNETLYAINETTGEYISGTFKHVSICLVMLLRSFGKWAGTNIVVKMKKPSNTYTDITAQVYKKTLNFYKH